MKTYPILFSSTMVYSLKKGVKSQTRRTRNLAKINIRPNTVFPFKYALDCNGLYVKFNSNFGALPFVKCPYGIPGDVLWVKETFRTVKTGLGNLYYYKADETEPESKKWKSALHMPKAAARIFLKITDISVERVMDITEEDAKKEGVINLQEHEDVGHDWRDYTGLNCCVSTAKKSFLSLWMSINGVESLINNPWVWVIEFEQCEKPENF